MRLEPDAPGRHTDRSSDLPGGGCLGHRPPLGQPAAGDGHPVRPRPCCGRSGASEEPFRGGHGAHGPRAPGGVLPRPGGGAPEQEADRLVALLWPGHHASGGIGGSGHPIHLPGSGEVEKAGRRLRDPAGVPADQCLQDGSAPISPHRDGEAHRPDQRLDAADHGRPVGTAGNLPAPIPLREGGGDVQRSPAPGH